MPVARVMALYRKYSGKEYLQTASSSGMLDVTGSRTDNTFFLHIVNTSRTQTIPVEFKIDGMKIISAKVYEISEDPEYEIISAENDRLQPKEKSVEVNRAHLIPPASVTAVELIAATT